MEEIDVVFGGFNMEKAPNNPPNSEKLGISYFSINAMLVLSTHNVDLEDFSTLSKWSLQAWFELLF
jgi:hypothetical protein